MGIRFYCPQGHKLNVKSFLAGKTGFCPYCHARLEIPLSSLRESSRAGQKSGDQGDDEPLDDIPLAQPAPVTQASGEDAADVPVAKTVAPSNSSSPQTLTAGTPSPAAATNGPTAAQPGEAQPTAGEPVAASAAGAAEHPPRWATDPIAEAPQAVWYVRPASGGQYGPASAEVMRQWLDEGRVGADSLVWREGWPDWRQAAATFPEFQR